MAAPNTEPRQDDRAAGLRERAGRLARRVPGVERLVPRTRFALGGLGGRSGGPRAGWRVVAAKEFGDNIGSIRFLVLLVIIALACVGAVATAAGSLRDAATQASEAPSPFLLLFTFAPEDQTIPAFVALIAFLGPLLGIAFGFDAVNQERADGTLPRLISQPIHRDDVVNGKFVAGLVTIGLTLVTLVAVTSGVGILRLGITPAAGDVVRLLSYLVITLAYIGVWLAFAVLCSVLLRRAATAALVAISVWLVLTLFGTWLAGIVSSVFGPGDQVGQARLEFTLSQLTPAGLYDQSSSALLNPSVRTLDVLSLQPEQVDRAVPSILSLDQSILIAWPQLTALIAGCVVLFAVAYVAFLRQEIRA